MCNDYYVMKRGWMSHQVFQKEPFTEREAWCWIIEHARWKHGDELVRVGKSVVTLNRGQLSYSVRYLAEAWGWKPAKTHRFIEKLKKWNKIETVSETGVLVVTVCNYSKYQIDYEKSETVSETAARQQRDSSETNKKKDKKDKKVYTPPTPPNGFPIPEWLKESIWVEFVEYRADKKKPMSEKAAKLAITTLENLRAKGYTNSNAVLRYVIARDWDGIYEPKQDFHIAMGMDFENSRSTNGNWSANGSGKQAGLLGEYGVDTPRRGTPEWKAYMREMQGEDYA